MVKGFVAGVLWGGVVAGAGLGVVSVMAPIKSLPEAVAVTPDQPVKTVETAQPAEPVKPGDPAAAEGAVVEAKPAEKVPEAVAESSPVVAPETVVPKGEPVQPEPEVVAEAKPALPVAEEPVAKLKPAEAAVAEVPAEPTPLPETNPAAQTEAPSAVTPAPNEVPATSPVTEAAVPDLPKTAEPPLAALPEASPEAEPAPDAKAETKEALLTPAPEVVEPKPATISPDPVEPEAKAEVQPEPTAPEQSATLAPAPGLKDEVAGVTTGRLPSIGAENADPAPEVAADLPPYRRFARSFENPDGKPLFSILLIDPGTPDLDRAQLAALTFPVTFAVDPLAENAAAAAATYRAAGQEVVMLATGIPEGAKPSDLEQTFAAYATALPEAVAVLDLGAGGFQDARGLATDVVGLIKAQGRGVLTYDRGLNAADQVARRDGVPAGLVFRSLDDEGEDTPLIRRYLDRAAFKAAQEGKVVVVGTARPETIAALLEWAVEGRAASVALAPASAVLSVK